MCKIKVWLVVSVTLCSQPKDNSVDTHRERDAENEEMKSCENTSFLSCAYRLAEAGFVAVCLESLISCSPGVNSIGKKYLASFWASFWS